MRYLILFFFSLPLYAYNLLILGDSLSAGYKIPVEERWSNYISTEFSALGYDVAIYNASVSGYTTSNVIEQLDFTFKQIKPDWVLIEIGANDGLQGFPVSIIEKNLNQIIEYSLSFTSTVFLMQIKVPTNYGRRYTQSFESLYPQLADKYNVYLLPFLLDFIAHDRTLMMEDGIHPKVEAQRIIAKQIASEMSAFF